MTFYFEEIALFLLRAGLLGSKDSKKCCRATFFFVAIFSVLYNSFLSPLQAGEDGEFVELHRFKDRSSLGYVRGKGQSDRFSVVRTSGQTLLNLGLHFSSQPVVAKYPSRSLGNQDKITLTESLNLSMNDGLNFTLDEFDKPALPQGELAAFWTMDPSREGEFLLHLFHQKDGHIALSFNKEQRFNPLITRIVHFKQVRTRAGNRRDLALIYREEDSRVYLTDLKNEEVYALELFSNEKQLWFDRATGIVFVDGMIFLEGILSGSMGSSFLKLNLRQDLKSLTAERTETATGWQEKEAAKIFDIQASEFIEMLETAGLGETIGEVEVVGADRTGQGFPKVSMPRVEQESSKVPVEAIEDEHSSNPQGLVFSYVNYFDLTLAVQSASILKSFGNILFVSPAGAGIDFLVDEIDASLQQRNHTSRPGNTRASQRKKGDRKKFLQQTQGKKPGSTSTPKPDAALMSDKKDGPGELMLIRLTAAQMMKGAGVLGATHRNIEEFILEPQKKNPRAIFLIENAERLVGEGAHSESSQDFFTDLAPYIESGKVQIVMSTTPEGFKTLPKQLVDQHFTLLRLESKENRSELVDFLTDYAQGELGFKLEERAVKILTSVAKKNLPGLAEPGRSLSLLSSFAKSRAEDSAEYIRQDFTIDTNTFSTWLDDYLQIPLQERPTAEGRAEAIRILNNFIETMSSVYAGEESIKKLLKTLLTTYLGQGQLADKPRGRYLIIGLPGVGKTSLAEAYSLAVNGRKPIEINMSSFSPGTRGAQEKFLALLSAKLREDPYGVFVFNEIENASLDVQMVLYEIMDRPYLSNQASGNRYGGEDVVTLHTATFFFTSNVGSKILAENENLTALDSDSFVEQLKGASNSDSSPAQILLPLLNRMGRVLIVRGPETEEAYRDILETQIKSFVTEHTKSGRDVSIKNGEALHKFLDLFVSIFPLGSERSLRRPVSSLKDTLALAVSLETLMAPPEISRCQLSWVSLSDAAESFR